MRKRNYDRKPYRGNVERIELYYHRLRELCGYGQHITHESPSYEDIFHDTVIHVMYDREALEKADGQEFIDHFLFRFRMISYQTIKDKQLKNKGNAIYKQAEKDKTEGW